MADTEGTEGERHLIAAHLGMPGFRNKEAALGFSDRDAASAFWRDGFVVLRGIFSREETRYLRTAIVQNPSMNAHAQAAKAKFEKGKYPSFETIFVWNDTSGLDIFAKFTRRRRIWEVLRWAFDDEVYVYHNKVAVKYPGMPGFKFHQDYAYWYSMGCLYPNMATCYIAVDPATTQNGCLRLIAGSHLLGRIDHVQYEGTSDSGVDEDRLWAIQKRLSTHVIPLEPGDCILFHCNTLHGSDPNLSDQSRLALLGCYNTKGNEPYIDHEHPKFLQQEPVDDPVTEVDIERLPNFKLHYREK